MLFAPWRKKTNMKKLILFGAVIILTFACTPKASKSTASSTAAGHAPNAPSAKNGPNEENLTAAKTKFADVTMDQLSKGHSIYFGACTKCHGSKNIARRDEKEWTEVLNEMAPKAHLEADEKEAVWRYIMSVKLASK